LSHLLIYASLQIATPENATALAVADAVVAAKTVADKAASKEADEAASKKADKAASVAERAQHHQSNHRKLRTSQKKQFLSRSFLPRGVRPS
jgi:hypothetical protein